MIRVNKNMIPRILKQYKLLEKVSQKNIFCLEIKEKKSKRNRKKKDREKLLILESAIAFLDAKERLFNAFKARILQKPEAEDLK